MTLTLIFTGTHFERRNPLDKFDLLLGVVANFEISVGNRQLYCEESFPIVELRVQMAAWLDQGLPVDLDFALDSMESDEPGLVWIRLNPDGKWRVGSLYQEYIEISSWTKSEIVDAATRFIVNVDAWVESNLHVRVADIVKW